MAFPEGLGLSYFLVEGGAAAMANKSGELELELIELLKFYAQNDKVPQNFRDSSQVFLSNLLQPFLTEVGFTFPRSL